MTQDQPPHMTASDLPHAEHQLDTRGLYCPEPVMMLHNQIRDMSAGEIVHVLASDPATERDIPKFCNFLKQSLLASEVTAQEFHYWIKKN